MAEFVEVETVRSWLADGGEIAFLDVREEGQHGSGHPLLAVNLPYSRLERDIARLVPRRACRLVLLDGADGIAAEAARRLDALGYSDIHILTGGVLLLGRLPVICAFQAPTSRARPSPKSSSMNLPRRRFQQRS